MIFRSSSSSLPGLSRMLSDADLPDIVHRRGQLEQFGVLWRYARGQRQAVAILAHPVDRGSRFRCRYSPARPRRRTISTLREALRIGVDPAALVHALQNHDELTG